MSKSSVNRDRSEERRRRGVEEGGGGHFKRPHSGLVRTKGVPLILFCGPLKGPSQENFGLRLLINQTYLGP